MYLRIPKLLNKDQVASVNKVMDEARFVEGKTTGGLAVQDIKNNLQLDRGTSKKPSKTDDIILKTMWNHPTVRAAVIPKQILVPYYSKYGEGMEYGAHVDNPIMAQTP